MKTFSSSFLAGIASIFALFLVLVAIGGAYLVTQDQINSNKAQQEQQSVQFEAHLCQTLNTLKAEKPPAGDPSTNPSRAFDQQQHDALAQLAADIGCPAIAP